MAIISVRLNDEDEKILQFLKDYYNKDRSSLIKKILQEKYEDIKDLKTILDFENNEDETSFLSIEEMVDG